MCVTLSLGYYEEGNLNVLCCDILANAPDKAIKKL
jgi:hypothetical protein